MVIEKTENFVCTKCGIEKDSTCFSLVKTPYSKGLKNYRVKHCKICIREKQRTWDRNNYKSIYRRRRTYNPAINILHQARQRARKFGVPYDLSVEDLLPLPKVCPVFGTPLEYASYRNNNNSPSLDRIIPTKGYVRGNVEIISNRANIIKRDATLEELIKLVTWLKKAIF